MREGGRSGEETREKRGERGRVIHVFIAPLFRPIAASFAARRRLRISSIIIFEFDPERVPKTLSAISAKKRQSRCLAVATTNPPRHATSPEFAQLCSLHSSLFNSSGSSDSSDVAMNSGRGTSETNAKTP